MGICSTVWEQGATRDDLQWIALRVTLGIQSDTSRGDIDRNPAEVVTAYRTGRIDKYWRELP